MCWRPRLSLLEKILKTRQTLTQLETELETKLKSVGTCLGLQSGQSSEDHASKDQRTPLHSMIDIRHCTSFIEKFLYHSRMVVHKPTTAVSQFQYVFSHDFDGGHFTVAQNGLPRESLKRLWTCVTKLHLKVYTELSSH